MKTVARFLYVILIITALCRFSVAGEEEMLRLKVSAPERDCVDVPLHVVVELPEQFTDVPIGEIRVELRPVGVRSLGVFIPGQIVTDGQGKNQLWWVAPRLKADKSTTWIANIRHGKTTGTGVFSWEEKESEYLDLLFDGRNVTRYMYTYDTSNPQRVFETYKPFLHVFDAQGRNLLTNGPDGMHPYLKDEIKYPHHRGIFIGWNKLEFKGKIYDLWHMKDVAQVHQKFLELAAGPVLARSKSLVHWNDDNGEPIIAEQRQTTIFRQSDPAILLLDFSTELKAVRGDVFLNGDPEHAGFQYRAHDAVAKGGEEVKAAYLFHKDGIDPKKDKDLPWVAMSYGLNGHHYTVQHMNHPDNPKSTVYSAYRDYGRFGAFFTERLSSGQTLRLNYRIWIVKGEMLERQKLTSKYEEFTNVSNVEVLAR